MTAANYAQMNAIPIIVLAVVYADMRKRLVLSRNNRLLGRMAISLIGLFIVDTLGWTLNGVSGAFSRAALYTADMIYYALVGILPYQWLIYAQRRIRGDYDGKAGARMVIFTIPLLIHFVFLALTPLTGAYFTVDANNVYHRGNLLAIQQIVSTGYMLLGAVMGFLYRRQAVTAEKKRECTLMSILVIMPLVLAVLQVLFYGVSLFLPGAAIAEVYLYFDILHYQVALDGMTGLNNRRSLDEYLIKRIDRSNAFKGDLYVMLMDINDFKSINDTYGHVDGDKAICLVALNLKYCFSKTDAFISRYGGDEFAVAVNCKNENEAKGFVERLHMPIKSWRPEAREPLYLSVGAARYDYSSPTTPEKLLREADGNMYIDKRITKSRRGGAV